MQILLIEDDFEVCLPYDNKASFITGQIIAFDRGLPNLQPKIKIWEVKHYLLAHLLKSKNSKFEEYDIKDIAHGLTDCHEEVGLSASLYYNFKKFNTTKVYNCLIGHLEHGH